MRIAIRADAGFALPALYDYCEREGIELTIALLSNSRLAAQAACKQLGFGGHSGKLERLDTFGEMLL